MEATSAPDRRISVGDVINETFSIYGQQFVPSIGSAIVVFVVVGIIAWDPPGRRWTDPRAPRKRRAPGV